METTLKICAFAAVYGCIIALALHVIRRRPVSSRFPISDAAPSDRGRAGEAPSPVAIAAE